MSINPDQASSADAKQRGIARRLLYASGVLLMAYLALAYFLLPIAWRADTRRHHPDLNNAPRITHTANGIPGDPINVALIGSQTDVVHAMLAAEWFPADPITFHTSLQIAVDSVFRKPDDEAPVSSLFLFGRKQDLAFEQPVGNSPRQRHHVRFWRWDEKRDDREVWFGAVTFDERVGFSHTTGQITHHIGADVDAERDRLIGELLKVDQAHEVYWVDGFHKELSGKNGGGDAWHTDGRLEVARLVLHTNLPATQQ